ncbi:Bug family tripartite tricarboxylate transporter substrate binding protein [Bordetella sp. 2513F-2]
MERRTVLKSLGAVAALSWSLPGVSHAQRAAYGLRPIKMVVPYPPGGVTDIAGRMMGEVLAARYGQSVVVENRPGANGMIGLQAVAATPPDGYTLVTGGLGSNVIPPAVTKGMPLDVVRAFAPIAQAAEFVNVLVVRQDAPHDSVQALVKAAKAAPAEAYSYGSNGIGTSVHLTSEFFAQTQGLKFMHVPYKGSNEIMVDLVNGNLDFCFNNLPSVLPMMQAGKVRALAVTSPYRTRRLPDVPTMQEQGVQDFSVTSWLGAYGPAGMDPALVRELGDVIAQGLATPENRARLEAAGFEPRPGNAAQFAELNRKEFALWSEIARRAGISLDFGRG